MTGPIIITTGTACDVPKLSSSSASKWKTGDYIAVSAIGFDTVTSITCLVVGILGVISTIVMPVAAAYALIGVSVAITAMWALFLSYVFFCAEK